MRAILIKTYDGSKTEYPSVSEAKKASDNYLSKFEKSGLYWDNGKGELVVTAKDWQTVKSDWE